MKLVIRKENVIKLVLFIIIALLFLFTWSTEAIKYSKFSDVRWFFIIAMIYSLIVFTHFSYRAFLYIFYKATEPDPVYIPKISIIVPAYNEEKIIRKCLSSILSAQYPGEKEIICVNDGSKDKTAEKILEMYNEHQGKFKFINFKKNQGKRLAIAQGIRESKGEVIVLVDSDTIIKKDALIHLVAPFKDNSIGATTGTVRVLNENDNLLTKILSVRYIIAFDFYRISHSVIRTVMVCSGVLSAYRRTVINDILPFWLNQQFLGKKCTYGDDRSLTNFVLKNGFDTVYAQNAYAFTNVPNTLPRLAKMVSRWNKSYIRENIVFLSFILGEIKKSFKPIAIFDFFISNVIIILQYLAFIVSILFFSSHPIYILKFIATITIISMFYMFFYIEIRKNSDVIYGFLYSYLFLILLCWTVPYSFFTLKDDSWLTR